MESDGTVVQTTGLIPLMRSYWLPISVICTLVWLVWNKYQKQLAKIPGPAAASYTGLWRVYEVYKVRFHEKQIALHCQYGKLVRIAPHVVSVGDPTAIPIIYGLKHTFLKSGFCPIQYRENLWSLAESYGRRKHPEMNVFSTRNPTEHREEKRKVTNAYSMSSLLQLEDKVDSCTSLFMQRLEEMMGNKKDSPKIDIDAFDVIGEITFAEKLGFLDQGKDVDGMMKAIQGMLAYAAICGQVPEAHHFLLGNPLLTKFAPAMESWNQVLVFTLQAMKSRTNLERDEELADSDERWRAVKTTDPLKMSTRDIIVHLSTNVFAESDTTAIAPRSVIYHLCRNPDKMKKTVEEIDEADKADKFSIPISYKDIITHLPYFGDVLKGAMRLHPSVGLIMERIVPPEGVELWGKFISGGAIVGIYRWVLNYDNDIFQDADDFVPERWLEEGQEAQERENILNCNFGAGVRFFLGKNISMMEMHKILPELLRNFTIELTHPEKEWKITNYWFVQQEDMICTLTKRK